MNSKFSSKSTKNDNQLHFVFVLVSRKIIAKHFENFEFCHLVGGENCGPLVVQCESCLVFNLSYNRRSKGNLEKHFLGRGRVHKAQYDVFRVFENLSLPLTLYKVAGDLRLYLPLARIK